MIAGRPTTETIARHRKNAARFMWRAFGKVRGYEAFAPLKAQKPHPPGIPKGSQPLGAVSFPGFLVRRQEIPIKSFYKRFKQTSS
jgi:hypothetical protein